MTFFRRLREILHAMVGLPDYERYRQHFLTCHPGETPLTYERFYKQAQENRYNRNHHRCC